MKRFFAVLTICAFVLNAFTASALAFSCAGHSADNTHMEQSAHDMMPCHAPETESDTKNASGDHCDACVCFYTCTSQIPVMEEISFVPMPDYMSAEWALSQDKLTSHINAPPKRPPKIFS